MFLDSNSLPFRLRAFAAGLFLAASSVACLADTSPPANGGRNDTPVDPPPAVDPPGPTDPSPSPPAPAVLASAKGRLRFMGPHRYKMRLAGGLGLAPDALCRELGRFDCIDEAHEIVLGGVDAERLGFFEPLEDTTVTTPFAVDRVALSACTAAADRDLARPEDAAIFALFPDGDGRVRADDPVLQAVVRELYVRLLQRLPTDGEAGALVAMYSEVEATRSPAAARDWAAAACFAVATTEEALFY